MKPRETRPALASLAPSRLARRLASLGVLGLLFLPAGCESLGDLFDDAGDAAEEAADETGDAIEEAGDELD